VKERKHVGFELMGAALVRRALEAKILAGQSVSAARDPPSSRASQGRQSQTAVGGSAGAHGGVDTSAICHAASRCSLAINF
jgi:hypothetical protein